MEIGILGNCAWVGAFLVCLRLYRFDISYLDEGPRGLPFLRAWAFFGIVGLFSPALVLAGVGAESSVHNIRFLCLDRLVYHFSFPSIIVLPSSIQSLLWV